MRGIRSLKPIVLGGRSFTETELLRRQAAALDALTRIAVLLQSQGAPIRIGMEEE